MSEWLHEGKAFTLDGRMVDLPVIQLPERTLRAVRAVRYADGFVNEILARYASSTPNAAPNRIS